MRGGCCTVLIARFDVNANKWRLLLLLLLLQGVKYFTRSLLTRVRRSEIFSDDLVIHLKLPKTIRLFSTAQ